jgi:hypothetical protein
LWTVDGPAVRTIGVSLPTRMVVARLADGTLWIDSPVETNGELFEGIAALGTVAHLVAPTALHLWRLERWHARFPAARVWAPPALHGAGAVAFRTQVPRRLEALPFAGRLDDVPPAAWADTFEHVVFRGNVLLEEVEFLHKPSRTLLLTDFVQNYPARPGDLAGNVVKRLGGVLNGGVPRDVRWSFFDRRAARASLERVLAWDFDRVIVAHGACVEHGGKAFVANAFRWLSG